ncbi:unnamed protein product [Paramecium pentaurelia]|uniref:Uncharacterized protein n=1 Tax=Paramecium pentaurelia TaxID=43138 RepID=A0A8S1UR63_9CILI|nr:unnamed protein product [Paramecium pentaurelia]
MSDNLQVKYRRRNSPQEGEQDFTQRQENKYNKIQRNDLQAYVQQPKIKRNRDDQIEDPQEDDDENQSDKFGGFVFTKTKNEPKKQYIYEPKKQQPSQQEKKEYQPKKDQQPKKKPEKKSNKFQQQSQQQKEISIQQLGELEKLQQHLINCGISITQDQENSHSDLVLPPDFNKPLSIPSKPIVAPPPGLVDKDKSSDFVDILNQLQDNDSDGQMNYDQHFSSSVLTRGAFPIQTQTSNQFNNQKPIPNNNQNFPNNSNDQKNKEKKKKNKKKKPKNNKNQLDMPMMNNQPDFMNQNSAEIFDPFKVAPFSFPQQQMGRNNLPDPLNISGPTFTTPLGFAPPGMMGLGPQIAPFNSNLLGAPQSLGFPPGPSLGMDPLEPTFPMGPNIGPMRMNQMMPPKYNQMPNMAQMPMPMQMAPPPQMKKQSNKNHMMMQSPPNQFDGQVFCPPMMPPPMGNHFSDFPPTMPMGQQFPPNLMNSGPILGMPPMMPFGDDFDQNWMPNDGMIQMPNQMQVFSNQNFQNLSQIQHPDSYMQESENYMSQTKKMNEIKNGNGNNIDQINQQFQNTDGQPKQRKKLNLNSKPFYPVNP